MRQYQYGFSADVAIVIADIGAGGAQRVASLVANAWARAGKRVSIITLSSASSDFYPLDADIQRLSLSEPVRDSHTLIRAIAGNIRRIIKLRELIRKTGAPTVLSFVAGMNILAVLATKGMKCKVIISERNDPALQSLGWVWDRLRQLLYRQATLVTVNTEGGLHSLASFVPRERLRYLPNPLQLPQSIPSADSRSPVILGVGRLVSQKGFDLLLQAFALAAPRMECWSLAIAGEGPLATDLHQRALALGIADRVRFLGRVSNLDHYYRTAAIFALPSRFEGTPNALLEAMAYGLSCVVSDASPGPMAIMVPGKNGLIMKSGDVHSLADSLERLANDPGLRARFGAAARLSVEPFAQDQVLQEWTALLHGPRSW